MKVQMEKDLKWSKKLVEPSEEQFSIKNFFSPIWLFIQTKSSSKCSMFFFSQNLVHELKLSPSVLNKDSWVQKTSEETYNFSHSWIELISQPHENK